MRNIWQVLVALFYFAVEIFLLLLTILIWPLEKLARTFFRRSDKPTRRDRAQMNDAHYLLDKDHARACEYQKRPTGIFRRVFNAGAWPGSYGSTHI
jgi:hypothetical protein